MPSRSPILFFKRFLSAPGQIGAIAPSSRRLARLMASQLKPTDRVLEIGAGTGSLTHGILERIASPTQLTSVELDATLASTFHSTFPQVHLISGDAEQTLMGGERYDAIVSGIPFAIMEPAKRQRMFELAGRALTSTGVFIAFQYSLSSLAELKRHFKSVTMRYSFLNIPPAVVYICRGPKNDTLSNAE